MAKVAGVDLGTTTSAIATVSGGRLGVVPSTEGSLVTPVVVAFTERGEQLVGQPARAQAHLNPAGTLRSVRRFLGRDYASTATERARAPFSVVPGPGGESRYQVDGAQHTPTEIAALVLGKLAQDAGWALGDRVTEVVIAVPASFDGAQRRAVGEAGERAGLTVLGLIDEPVAVVRAYGLDLQAPRTVLVFDLGGGTLDVSLLDAGDGRVTVRAVAGDPWLGGGDFDQRIVDYVADEFHRQEGVELRGDPRTRQRLSDAAEKAKVELNTAARAVVSLPFITPGTDSRTHVYSTPGTDSRTHLYTTLARSTFEYLTADLVEHTAKPVRQVMADARISTDQIDEVIMVGGASRIPAVRAQLGRLLGGEEPTMTINPDEAVALGAAVEAALRIGQVRAAPSASPGGGSGVSAGAATGVGAGARAGSGTGQVVGGQERVGR